MAVMGFASLNPSYLKISFANCNSCCSRRDERAQVIRHLGIDRVDHGAEAFQRKDQLRLIRQQEIDEHQRGVRTRRVPDHGGDELHVGHALARNDRLDGKPLERGIVIEQERDVDRIFATRGAALGFAQVAGEHRLLLGELF
jgi:hypothetical protein